MTRSEADHVRDRLEILDALSAAVQRRAEVFDLIATAESPDRATDELMELLGVGRIGATAILDLQLRRLTERDRDRILAERDENRIRLAQLAEASATVI